MTKHIDTIDLHRIALKGKAGAKEAAVDLLNLQLNWKD